MFNGFSKKQHPSITVNSQAHKPNEDPVNPDTRHVTCADCMTRMRQLPDRSETSSVRRAAGIKGITAAGGIVQPIEREYELCFRCHGDSNARGQQQSHARSSRPTRASNSPPATKVFIP